VDWELVEAHGDNARRLEPAGTALDEVAAVALLRFDVRRPAAPALDLVLSLGDEAKVPTYGALV